ncbi:MAG: hypothetical protein R3E97_05520 [Candidatus Eisenbacteria bacterium]
MFGNRSIRNVGLMSLVPVAAKALARPLGHLRTSGTWILPLVALSLVTVVGCSDSGGSPTEASLQHDSILDVSDPGSIDSPDQAVPVPETIGQTCTLTFGNGCKADVTCKIIPTPVGAECARKWVKVTVKFTCGATCDAEFEVCGEQTNALEFWCNGHKYSLNTTSTWLGQANGTSACDNLSIS